MAPFWEGIEGHGVQYFCKCTYMSFELTDLDCIPHDHVHLAIMGDVVVVH